MENIYLDKTIFRILGGKVETVKKTKNKPMKLIDSISSVQDGQVYQVMFKTENNEFELLNQQPKLSFADRVAQ